MSASFLLTSMLLFSWMIASHPFVVISESSNFHKTKLTIRHTPFSLLSIRKSDFTVPVSSTGSTTNNEAVNTDLPKGIGNEKELKEYATSVGVTISLSTLGPGYRALARAVHDPELILGYCEGFIRPGGKILHVDKLECWKKALDKGTASAAKLNINSTSAANDDGSSSKSIFQRDAGQVFGVSLLLGYCCMLHGKANNCEIAEFLAIDDESFQHKRLVRFFRRAGFRVLRYVGDDLKDIPDRLVWGGCGTLMNRNIDELLDFWTGIIFVE